MKKNMHLMLSLTKVSRCRALEQVRLNLCASTSLGSLKMRRSRMVLVLTI